MADVTTTIEVPDATLVQRPEESPGTSVPRHLAGAAFARAAYNAYVERCSELVAGNMTISAANEVEASGTTSTLTSPHCAGVAATLLASDSAPRASVKFATMLGDGASVEGADAYVDAHTSSPIVPSRTRPLSATLSDSAINRVLLLDAGAYAGGSAASPDGGSASLTARVSMRASAAGCSTPTQAERYNYLTATSVTDWLNDGPDGTPGAMPDMPPAPPPVLVRVRVDGAEYAIPDNFGVVTDGVYRCAFPYPDAYPFLERLQLRTVINLLDKLPAEYDAFLQQRGIQYLHLAVKGNKAHCEEMDRTKVRTAIQHIIDTAAQPVLIHCRSGKHRTGAVIGCVRMLQQWTLEAACNEYVHYCKHKQRAVDKEFIERFDPRTLQDSAPPIDRLPEWLSPACFQRLPAASLDENTAALGIAETLPNNITRASDERAPFIPADSMRVSADMDSMGSTSDLRVALGSGTTRATPPDAIVAPAHSAAAARTRPVGTGAKFSILPDARGVSIFTPPTGTMPIAAITPGVS